MHALKAGFASSSMMPLGEWKGWSPTRVRSSKSRWMRGSCDTGG